MVVSQIASYRFLLVLNALLSGFCWSLSSFGDDTPSNADLSTSGLNLKIDHTQFSDSKALVGNGRYLAMAGRNDVNFLLDFSSMRISKLFTGDRSGHNRMAGTAKKLFCMSDYGTRITRYDLKTFQKEKSFVFPEFSKGVGVDLMAGANGNGPLGVITKRGNEHALVLLDIESLGLVENSKPLLISPDCRVSADGRVFSSVVENQLLVYDLDHLCVNETKTAAKSLLNVFAPKGYAPTNFNGSIVFSQFGPLSRCGEPLSSSGRWPRLDGIVIPASQGNLFAVVGNVPSARFAEPKSYAAIYSVGDTVPIGFVKDLPIETQTEGRSLDRSRSTIPCYESIWFVPEYEAIAVIGVHNIHLRRFSLSDELKRRGQGVLFVDSVPPANAFVGSTVRHEIEVVATKPPYTLRLTDGPVDAKLARNVFSWDVPKDFKLGEVIVRIEIVDSGGQRIEYPIPLQVVEHPSTGKTVERKPQKPAIETEKNSDFEIRDWKDQSDMVIDRGRFVRILDKKLVEIQREDGQLKTIDVKILSLDDIRYALAMSKAKKIQE